MKRILAVATNAAPALGRRKTGLWLSELTHFVEAVKAAGYEVDIASPQGGRVPLDEASATPRALRDPANVACMSDPAFAAALKDSLLVAQADPSRYDAVYLAGGHGAMFDFRESEALQRVVAAFYGQGKIVAAVCHGVAGLVGITGADGQPLVAGKCLTGFSNLEDRLAGAARHLPYLLETALKERGAKYEKALLPFAGHVVVDGNVLTGQNPNSVRPLAREVARLLGTSVSP